MIGIVVGAAPLGEEAADIKELIKAGNAYTVAADGGILFFIQQGIVPNAWLGDMDSFKQQGIMLPKSFKDVETSTVDPIKDVTDMELGLVKAIENGCDEIYIYGGMGGRRQSHTIANVQMLHKFAAKGRKIGLMGDGSEMLCVQNGTLELPARDSGFVSVFSLTDKSKGVKINGLFYDFGGELTNDFALGVSNEFCGKAATISVEEGTLLVVYEG